MSLRLRTLKMNSAQIEALIEKDPYLKRTQCSIIFEKEIPSLLLLNHIYFVLIPNGRVKATKETKFDLGHWIHLDTLLNNSGGGKQTISYVDPYGHLCSSDTLSKMHKTAEKYNLEVFINKIRIQDSFSVTCGFIISYFALLRSRNFSTKDILMKKISKKPLSNARVIPDIIASLLPRGPLRNRPRFSLDFF